MNDSNTAQTDRSSAASGLTDRLLTVTEVAKMTGYSEKWVRTAYLSGDLRAFQTAGKGGRVRVPLSAVYEWVGHSPARSTEKLEDTDWSIPREGSDPDDLPVCDEYPFSRRRSVPPRRVLRQEAGTGPMSSASTADGLDLLRIDLLAERQEQIRSLRDLDRLRTTLGIFRLVESASPATVEQATPQRGW